MHFNVWNIFAISLGASIWQVYGWIYSFCHVRTLFIQISCLMYGMLCHDFTCTLKINANL